MGLLRCPRCKVYTQRPFSSLKRRKKFAMDLTQIKSFILQTDSFLEVEAFIERTFRSPSRKSAEMDSFIPQRGKSNRYICYGACQNFGVASALVHEDCQAIEKIILPTRIYDSLSLHKNKLGRSFRKNFTNRKVPYLIHVCETNHNHEVHQEIKAFDPVEMQTHVFKKIGLPNAVTNEYE